MKTTAGPVAREVVLLQFVGWLMEYQQPTHILVAAVTDGSHSCSPATGIRPTLTSEQ